MEETAVWKGNSSPAINFGTYSISALLAALIIGLAVAFSIGWIAIGLVAPVAVAFWKWLENRCRVYEITNQRIKITAGVLSKRTEELELYRVRDTALEEQLLYRLFGAANILLYTADQSTPSLKLEAIRNGGALREELRKNVEICRDRKQVRLTEFET